MSLGKFGKNGGNLGSPHILSELAKQAVPINPSPGTVQMETRDASAEPSAPHPFDGIKAVGYYVVCEIVHEEARTLTGILVPEVSRRKTFEVISVGPQVKGIEVGDWVLPTMPGGPPLIALEKRTFTVLMQGDTPGTQQIGAVLSKASMRRHDEPSSRVDSAGAGEAEPAKADAPDYSESGDKYGGLGDPNAVRS